MTYLDLQPFYCRDYLPVHKIEAAAIKANDANLFTPIMVDLSNGLA